MRKAVKHLFAFADRMDRLAVILLIQEKARLLSIFHVYDIMHPVFNDLHLRVKRLTDKSFIPRQPLLFPHLGIAPLIDAPDMDAVLFQKIDQRF